jgi:hypothetical protein
LLSEEPTEIMSEARPGALRARRLGWPDAEVIIETPGVVLRYHARTKIVHHEFNRFVHGEEFRSLLERGLDLLERNQCVKWLSDDRGNGPLKPADAEWSTNHWSPRAMAAGWKYWAVVLPEKVLGQMNMKRFIEGSAEHGRIAQSFTDARAAMRWLEER